MSVATWGTATLGIFIPSAWRPALACGLLTSALASVGLPVYAQTQLPNADNHCPVQQFGSWFSSGNVSVNGFVDPPNSAAFSANSLIDCPFFIWSERMFLWATSPTPPASYGGGSHVFNSPVFYDVSPEKAGHRTFVPIVPGMLRTFNASLPQRGPTGQPVAFDKTGKMYTIVYPLAGPNRKPVIRNKAGKAIEIAQVKVARNGKPIFLDQGGKAIDFQTTPGGAPRLLDKTGKLIDIRPTTVKLNGRAFHQTGTINVVVDVEQGQADGRVLMAQNNSLVYYAIQVNDVFAYFLTGTKNRNITFPAGTQNVTPTHFPTDLTELGRIEQFAQCQVPPKTFPDRLALAVELKSAWVELTPNLDASKYITITATLPKYDTTSSPPDWVASGTRQAQLALVGMHVVGSAGGHPEMIWATFEHVGNTPNNSYYYVDASGPTQQVVDLGSSSGTWLFANSNTVNTADVGQFNQQNMLLSGADIHPTVPQPPSVGPIDVLRINPWGTSNNIPKNTMMIAVNNSIISQLAPGDVRRNYIMTGSTWTNGGPPTPSNALGTNQMANSTIETFGQPNHCFQCHRDLSGQNMLGLPTGGLSHVWGPLWPLAASACPPQCSGPTCI